MTPDASPPPSPSRGVIALHTNSEHDWQPILHSSNQVVLYNPKSHALTISQSSSSLPVHGKPCPYCRRILPDDFEQDTTEGSGFDEADPTYQFREPDYFRLLAFANENASGLPPLTDHEERGRSAREETSRAFPPNTMAEGYFKRFFQEEYKLGMGANGTVYLCQVSFWVPFSVYQWTVLLWKSAHRSLRLLVLAIVETLLHYSICLMETRLVRN